MLGNWNWNDDKFYVFGAVAILGVLIAAFGSHRHNNCIGSEKVNIRIIVLGGCICCFGVVAFGNI